MKSQFRDLFGYHHRDLLDKQFEGQLGYWFMYKLWSELGGQLWSQPVNRLRDKIEESIRRKGISK